MNNFNKMIYLFENKNIPLNLYACPAGEVNFELKLNKFISDGKEDVYIFIPNMDRRKFRVRCEMIILDHQGKILVDRHKPAMGTNVSYRLPGGGINIGETILEAAIRETKEEALIICNPAINSNLYYFHEIPDSEKERYGYWGKAVFICVGYYSKIYTNFVNEEDRTKFPLRAEWIYPQYISDLYPLHKKAIDIYNKRIYERGWK